MDEMEEERDAAERAIRSLQMQATRFEIFPARPETAKETSLEEVEDSEIFIQIIGEDISEIVAMEYEKAAECDCKILIFVKNVDRTGGAERYLERLRERHVYKKFTNRSDLEEGITYSIQYVLTSALRQGRKGKGEGMSDELIVEREFSLGLLAPSRRWIKDFKVHGGDRIKGIIRGTDVFSACVLTEKEFARFEAGDDFRYLDGKEVTRACAIDVVAREYDTWYLVVADKTWFGLDLYVRLSRIREGTA